MTGKNEHIRKKAVFDKPLLEFTRNTEKNVEVEVLHKFYRGLVYLTIVETLCMREQKPDL